MASVSKDKFNIQVLPSGVDNAQFQQRESGVVHTPYRLEVEFYNLIKNGDVKGVQNAMGQFVQSSLVVGRMSNDSLRQAQYLAVSCITLATRYAVEGGLLESEAYNLSDGYIQSVDKMTSVEEILGFLMDKAIELTSLVNAHAKRLEYPPHVLKAMKYVSGHLHERMRCRDVANACGVSADYLSATFKKSVGVSLARYIVKEKLEESKTLLQRGVEYGEIGYYLGFCSQTHYIECFKKEYGTTPKRYAKQNYRL